MKILPLQHAIFCEAALQSLLCKRYGLGPNTTCRLYIHSQNDLYQICAGKHRYYFKVYQYGRSIDEVQSEVNLLRHLLRCHVPVAPPMPDESGRWVATLPEARGVRAGVLYREAPGSARGPNTNTPLTVQDMWAFGTLVGELHKACDLYHGELTRPQLDFSYLVTRPLRNIRPFLTKAPALFNELQQMAAELKTQIAGQLTRRLPEYGLCHGDLHAGNLHFSVDNKLTLFDFDSCGYGWRAYDIAKIRRLMLWFPKSSLKETRADDRRWQAFLRGYRGGREISAGELGMIAAFIPLHHLWWMGLKIEMAAQVGCKDLGIDFFQRQAQLIKKWL